VAATLSDHDVDDESQVSALLDQVEQCLACFIADGADALPGSARRAAWA
jgi:hypothetical protein